SSRSVSTSCHPEGAAATEGPTRATEWPFLPRDEESRSFVAALLRMTLHHTGLSEPQPGAGQPVGEGDDEIRRQQPTRGSYQHGRPAVVNEHADARGAPRGR